LHGCRWYIARLACSMSHPATSRLFAGLPSRSLPCSKHRYRLRARPGPAPCHTMGFDHSTFLRRVERFPSFDMRHLARDLRRSTLKRNRCLDHAAIHLLLATELVTARAAAGAAGIGVPCFQSWFGVESDGHHIPFFDESLGIASGRQSTQPFLRSFLGVIAAPRLDDSLDVRRRRERAVVELLVFGTVCAGSSGPRAMRIAWTGRSSATPAGRAARLGRPRSGLAPPCDAGGLPRFPQASRCTRDRGGARARIRTWGLPLRRRSLYPTELHARVEYTGQSSRGLRPSAACPSPPRPAVLAVSVSRRCHCFWLRRTGSSIRGGESRSRRGMCRSC
jgi:hypothetical protein